MHIKTAIVTGASSGIGRAVAKHLYSLGYQLGLVARDEEKLKLFKHELMAEPGAELKAIPLVLQADVGDEKEIIKVVDHFVESTGSLAVLVNSAGILKQGTTELDLSDFQQLVNTNIIGLFNCIKAATPYLKKQKFGYIFNVSSTAGKVGFADLGGYSASKFAVVGLGQAVMKELASYGIKVTTLCPNLISTNMTKNITIMPHEKMIPVGDIAHTIEFLLKLSPYTIIPEVSLDCTDLIQYDR